jgi:hypothetical protein
VLVADVGVPDGTLGVRADSVRVVARRLRPHAPVAEPAVAADVVAGEPVRVRLGHDQRGTVGADRHPVGEREVAGHLAHLALRRDEYDQARRVFTAGKVETDRVDVGVALVVHHDVVPRLVRDSGKFGMLDQ